MNARRRAGPESASGQTLESRAQRFIAAERLRSGYLHPLLLAAALRHDGDVYITAEGMVTFYRER